MSGAFENTANTTITNGKKLIQLLRAIKCFLTGDFSGFSRLTVAVKARVRDTTKYVFTTILAYVQKNPSLLTFLKRLLIRFPLLRHRLIRVASSSGALDSQSTRVPPELDDMTPRAREIYEVLKLRLERNNRTEP